mgnify:CR=1 FL=1
MIKEIKYILFVKMSYYLTSTRLITSKSTNLSCIIFRYAIKQNKLTFILYFGTPYKRIYHFVFVPAHTYYPNWNIYYSNYLNNYAYVIDMHKLSVPNRYHRIMLLARYHLFFRNNGKIILKESLMTNIIVYSLG